MTEQEYQRSRFVDRYRGDVKVKVLKIIFNKAWFHGTRLRTIIEVADLMVFSYKLNGVKK